MIMTLLISIQLNTQKTRKKLTVQFVSAVSRPQTWSMPGFSLVCASQWTNNTGHAWLMNTQNWTGMTLKSSSRTLKRSQKKLGTTKRLQKLPTSIQQQIMRTQSTKPLWVSWINPASGCINKPTSRKAIFSIMSLYKRGIKPPQRLNAKSNWTNVKFFDAVSTREPTKYQWRVSLTVIDSWLFPTDNKSR